MEQIRYFDGHCDTIFRCYETGEEIKANGGHIALDRIEGFSGYGQVFAIFRSAEHPPKNGMLSAAKEQYALFCREVERNPQRLIHCRNGADVTKYAGPGRICALLSIEGGDLLECDPDNLALAEDWGVKLINPTWNCANALSGSHCQDADRGLSDLGRAFVRQAEQSGILMDVSHLSEKGFRDLMDMTSKPVVASHSNSRAVFPHSRGLSDDQFRAICQTGGVVGLNFYADFVGVNPDIGQLIRHLERYLRLGGERHVAIGADFDGCDQTVTGIGGVQDVPKLWQALYDRGYPGQLLDDIFWNNWMRLF